MSETLPPGWLSEFLVKIIQSVKTGVPVFKGKKEYYSTGSIQLNGYSPAGQYNFTNRPSRANRIAIENDVFQARMKETDKALIIDKELNEQLFSTGFLQLRPFGASYNPRLLYYYIKAPTFLNQRNDLATGSTQEALTDTKAVEITAPLPPLNEQNRIVAKLEIHYQKAKAKVDKLSQSVLAKAFRGELVPQDPSDEPAEKLLERILEEKARMEAEMKAAKTRKTKERLQN